MQFHVPFSSYLSLTKEEKARNYKINIRLAVEPKAGNEGVVGSQLKSCACTKYAFIISWIQSHEIICIPFYNQDKIAS